MLVFGNPIATGLLGGPEEPNEIPRMAGPSLSLEIRHWDIDAFLVALK
jgi:hypothetical protein